MPKCCDLLDDVSEQEKRAPAFRLLAHVDTMYVCRGAKYGLLRRFHVASTIGFKVFVYISPHCAG